jgi:hypothetical protein
VPEFLLHGDCQEPRFEVRPRAVTPILDPQFPHLPQGLNDDGVWYLVDCKVRLHLGGTENKDGFEVCYKALEAVI